MSESLKRNIPCLLLLIVMIYSVPAAAFMYKWKDKKGDLQITDEWGRVPSEYYDTVEVIDDGRLDPTIPPELRKKIRGFKTPVGDPYDQPPIEEAPSAAAGVVDPELPEQDKADSNEIYNPLGPTQTIKRIYGGLTGEIDHNVRNQGEAADLAAGEGGGGNAEDIRRELTEKYGQEQLEDLPPEVFNGNYDNALNDMKNKNLSPRQLSQAVNLLKNMNNIDSSQGGMKGLSAGDIARVVWESAKESGMTKLLWVHLILLITCVVLFIYSGRITAGPIRTMTRLSSFAILLGGGGLITIALALPLLPRFTASLADNFGKMAADNAQQERQAETDKMIEEIRTGVGDGPDENEGKLITDYVRDSVEDSLEKGKNRSLGIKDPKAP